MRDKKIYIIVGIIVVGLFAFIFWLFFAIVSYRRAIYSYETMGKACYKDEYKLYYEKDDVKYYSACFDEVNVIEERFIFKKKYPLKKYIADDSFRDMLQKEIIYKYQYEFGIQTDYYISNYNTSADGDLVITKCSESDETSYYIHRNEDHTLCSFLHRYHEQNK